MLTTLKSAFEFGMQNQQKENQLGGNLVCAATLAGALKPVVQM